MKSMKDMKFKKLRNRKLSLPPSCSSWPSWLIYLTLSLSNPERGTQNGEPYPFDHSKQVAIAHGIVEKLPDLK